MNGVFVIACVASVEYTWQIVVIRASFIDEGGWTWFVGNSRVELLIA